MFTKVKGVVDNFFTTPQINQLIKKIEEHISDYNFYPIDIPILEHLQLFQRGLGIATDVVNKEMFIIQPKETESDNDRASKNTICLRPEGTAGTIRAFLEIQSQVALPSRVYFYGPMFRYERPQKGRLRQFHQFNMELLGAASIEYDVFLINMLHDLFCNILLMKDVTLFINFLGQPEDRKLFTHAFIQYIEPHAAQLCSTCQTRVKLNPLRILDCKSSACQNIALQGPKLETFFSEKTKQEWLTLQNLLQTFSIPFTINPHLVRGLDYYNKTVFEFVCSDLGAQNTFCGGGRYDSLAEQLGSKTSVPAIGCAIGIERLILILEAQKYDFNVIRKPLVCIIPVSEQEKDAAILLAQKLFNQTKKYRIEMLIDDTKMKHKMKQANDLKADFVFLLGDQEIKNKTVTIKNMITGSQDTVSIDQVL